MIKRDWELVGAGLVLVIVSLFFVAWLREHDARLIAEQTVRDSQARVNDLGLQIDGVQRTARDTVAKLQKQAATVKTTADAIKQIPTVTDAPLNTRALPDMPNAVAVDAVPFYEALNACRVQAVQLGACTTKAGLTDEVVAEKDKQIKALTNPGGFWKRLGRTVKDVGIGVAIGYGLHAATGH